MSKIEEMIRDLCPDGVRWLPIEEIFILRNGYTPSKSETSFWEGGNLPWFRMEDIRENGRILSDSILHITESALKKNGLFPANSIIVSTSATIGEHALITVPSLANQRFTYLVTKDEYKSVLDIKFAFYYMFVVDEWCKQHTNTSGFASVDMDGFRQVSFPLPPLPIQEKIVEILDKFSLLSAELEAELEGRRKQYDFYRNRLLSFDSGSDSVQWKALSEVGEFIRGRRFVRTDIVEEGQPCIHYGDMYTYYGLEATETRTHLPEDFPVKLRYAEKGDVVIVAAGENDWDIGVGMAWMGERPVAVHDACFIFKSEMNPKYVAHYLRTEKYHTEIRKYVSSAKICAINSDGLGKAMFPVRPLAEQERIVRFLDKFEALVTDLSAGLPAEIERVQKQYEYYRNKLLTFPEV